MEAALHSAPEQGELPRSRTPRLAQVHGNLEQVLQHVGRHLVPSDGDLDVCTDPGPADIRGINAHAEEAGITRAAQAGGRGGARGHPQVPATSARFGHGAQQVRLGPLLDSSLGKRDMCGERR